MTRRSDLADAAIETLAAAGMRGLTHRAVDRRAGLPEGSTSYYFRTRQALLQAVVERLAELTTAEIPALPVTDLDAAAEAIATIIETGATTGRSRHLARYELILESGRRPELRAALTASWAVVQGAVAEQLAALGLADPRRRAVDLLALLDGLLFDAIAGTGDRDLAGPGLRATVQALLTAVIRPDPATRA
jgi:DNA-binding transcriptional regulator YbjK